MKRIVALCGLMGSGKTTSGKIAAQILKMPFVDLDEIIEDQEGKTIPSIFTEEGESVFRIAETKALKNIVPAREPFVLALGGGTVCQPGNLALIKENCLLIYLQNDPPVLAARLLADIESRPMLKRSGEPLELQIDKLLTARKSYYEQAHIILNGVNLGPEELAQRIAAAVREHTS